MKVVRFVFIMSFGFETSFNGQYKSSKLTYAGNYDTYEDDNNTADDIDPSHYVLIFISDTHMKLRSTPDASVNQKFNPEFNYVFIFCFEGVRIC